MSEKTEFLSKIPFFEGVERDDLLILESIMRARHCRKKSLLFSQGEPGEAIFFVMTGKVKIYKTSEIGRAHV